MKKAVVALAFALLAVPALAQSSATPSPRAQGAANSAPDPSTSVPAGAASPSPQGGNPTINDNLGSTMAPSTQLPGVGPSVAPGQGASPAPAR